jgi:hypothetical protein
MTPIVKECITTAALAAGTCIMAAQVDWSRSPSIEPWMGGVLAGTLVHVGCMIAAQNKPQAISRWSRFSAVVTGMGLLQAKCGFLKTWFDATNPAWAQFNAGMNTATLAFRVMIFHMKEDLVPVKK